MAPSPYTSTSLVSTIEDVTLTSDISAYENQIFGITSLEQDESSDELFVVSTYTNFSKLAHGPRGNEANESLYVFRLNPADGSMVLLNITGDKKEVINPAFSRYHPRLNVIYTCTEDIENDGQILAYRVDKTGQLTKISEISAGGTSTCYITIDKAQRNLLAVNYWDSTLVVVPLSTETGEFVGPIKNIYDPKKGQKIIAELKKNGGCNHSNNDESTIAERQKDPHSHALVLDRFVGTVAYVPDLGKDLIREFLYDKKNGEILMELNALPSGMSTGMPDGPRYLCFHPTYDIVYVVNELSSTIAVFSVDRALLEEISLAMRNKEPMERFKNRSSLKLIQSISTLPQAFPKKMNTCGRICVHNSGNFVIVSNRGHESIAIFRVDRKGTKKGCLRRTGFYHTRGETPRHFKFDFSGQYLVVANQDSNTIAVFSFKLSTGEIVFTGNEYRVPSPNFICSCPIAADANFSEEKSVDSSEGILLNAKSEEASLQTELYFAQQKILELEARLSRMPSSN